MVFSIIKWCVDAINENTKDVCDEKYLQLETAFSTEEDKKLN